MASSKATTVEQYFAELPAERREQLRPVYDVMQANMPDGYEAGMLWGMICWTIPLSRYPDTYNKQPLAYAALAAQKNAYSIYLNCVYQDAGELEWFQSAWKSTGKKLDMGKSCIRYKQAADVPLEVLGEVIARTAPDEFIAGYEHSRSTARRGG